MEVMTISNLLVKMECQLLKSSITKCLLIKNMKEKWTSMEKKSCLTNNISNKNNNPRKIQSKIKFKRLNRFVLITMHCSVILNFQQMILPCTMIRFNHLIMPWICQW